VLHSDVLLLGHEISSSHGEAVVFANLDDATALP